MQKWFNRLPNNFGRVEVNVMRPLDFGVNKIFRIRLVVDVQHFHRDVSIFVQTSSIGFDDEVRAFDVRRELLDGVRRVAVQTSGFLTKISREKVRRFRVVFVDRLHSTLQENDGRFPSDCAGAV